MSEIQKKRWSILMINSLFGYQFERGTQEEHFAFCYCDEDMSLDTLRAVKRHSGNPETLVHDDFIGHGYLKIHMSEVDKIPDVFNAMLATGQWFRTNNPAQVGFAASSIEFSEEIMERKFVEATRRDILNNAYMRKLAAGSRNLIKWQALKPWNYTTEEGRHLCRELRELCSKGPAKEDSKVNYWRWDVFKEEIQEEEVQEEEVQEEEVQEEEVQEEEVQEEEVQIQKKAKISEEEEEDDFSSCMICLDAAPDTMVLPCEHVVVCSACSQGLMNTADANTCVQCRRPINWVIDLSK